MATTMTAAKENSSSVPRRFGRVLLRSPKYLVLAGSLARDARLSQAQRAAAWICLGYAIWPIDLVPGFIPVAGQLDDLAVLIGGLRIALRTCPRGVAKEHLSRAGLTTGEMDADLRTLGATTAWVAGKAGAFLATAAGALARNGVTRVQEAVRERLPGR